MIPSFSTCWLSFQPIQPVGDMLKIVQMAALLICHIYKFAWLGQIAVKFLEVDGFFAIFIYWLCVKDNNFEIFIMVSFNVHFNRPLLRKVFDGRSDLFFCKRKLMLT